MTTLELQNISDNLKCLIANKTNILLNNERFGTCLPKTLQQELTILNNYNDIITNILSNVNVDNSITTESKNIVITLSNGTTILKEEITTIKKLENCITEKTINTFELVILNVPPNPIPSDWEVYQVNNYIRPVQYITLEQTNDCQSIESTPCFDNIINNINQLIK